MQSETPLEGDEEENAPLLAEGGFFRFSGELNTEKVASVSIWPGAFAGACLEIAKRCIVLRAACLSTVYVNLALWTSQVLSWSFFVITFAVEAVFC